jgi:AcrR family transcriptional regulator
MARASQLPRDVRIRSSASDKRIAILRAARALVADLGFRETQMTSIAEGASVALGTLYRYFPSKAELMVEVVGLVSQREVDVAAGVAMGDGSAVERLAQAAWTFASRAVRGRKLAYALVAEPVEPEIEAARLQYRRKLARVFETIIEQGIRSEEMPEQNIQAAAACIVGSLFEGLVGPLASDTSSSIEDRYRQTISVVGFCLRGVCGRTISFEPSTDQPIINLDGDPLEATP